MRELSYRVYDNREKEYSDKAFSLDQYGILYVQDEDGYWEEASDRYVIEFATGLKDKNGKEIYEGDIIHRGALPKVNVFRNSVICFDEESVGFIATSTRNGVRTLFNGHTCDEIEVIGNIHENPELLKD